MAVKIIHKHSSVEDKRPTAAQLENGELGLNYNAAGAFLTCRDTDGNIQQVGGVKISDNAPDNPPIQCLWFKPADLTLFVFDGNNWLPVAGGGGGGGGGGTGDISTIIGNDGIDANEVAGVVTLDVDLDGNNCGLKFNSSRLSAEIASETKLGSVKIGDGIDVAADGTISVDTSEIDLTLCTDGGLAFDPTDECYSVDWEKLPTNNDLDWNGTSWEVDWQELPTDNSLDWSNNQWGVDWSTFPGGDNIDWDPVDEEWDVTLRDPIIISEDNPDPVVDNYFWWNSNKGELFVGYTDKTGDSYWIEATKPGKDGADGKDGDPVIYSQDTPPTFQEDVIWFNTDTGEAFFGYKDADDDEYWISLTKPGADGAPGRDGDPVVYSQDNPPTFQEDVIWFNTDTGEAFFGYRDRSGDEYWISLSKPGADGAPGRDGVTVIVSETAPGSPVNGQIWHNSNTGTAYTYWESSGVWVSM